MPATHRRIRRRCAPVRSNLLRERWKMLSLCRDFAHLRKNYTKYFFPPTSWKNVRTIPCTQSHHRECKYESVICGGVISHSGRIVNVLTVRGIGGIRQFSRKSTNSEPRGKFPARRDNTSGHNSALVFAWEQIADVLESRCAGGLTCEGWSG